MSESDADASNSPAAIEATRSLQRRLAALAKDFAAIETSLSMTLLDPLRHGRRPSDECIDDLLDLVARFDELHSAVTSLITLPNEAATLGSMLAAMERVHSVDDWNAFLSTTKSILSSVPRITHPSVECPPALVQVRQAAAALLAELPADPGDLEAWRLRVRPFSSLWTLLTESDLDAESTERLEAEVAAAFGETMVRRSFITRLQVGVGSTCYRGVWPCPPATSRDASAPRARSEPFAPRWDERGTSRGFHTHRSKGRDCRSEADAPYGRDSGRGPAAGRTQDLRCVSG